jgi:hypothetical protein
MNASHSSNRLVDYILSKSVGSTGNLGLGKMKLRRERAEWMKKSLKCYHGDSRACEVRHIVFSLPRGTPRKEAKEALRAICADWLMTYAPERNWVFAIQFHNGICHGHLAVQNVGIDGKPLKIRPHQVQQMAKMSFTVNANSAERTGKQGLPFYSKPRKKLAVQELAELVFLANSTINKKMWNHLKATETVKNLRLKKDGTLLSFEFSGRRICLSTLRRCIANIPPSLSYENTTTPNTVAESPTIHRGYGIQLKRHRRNQNLPASVRSGSNPAHQQESSHPSPLRRVQPQRSR